MTLPGREDIQPGRIPPGRVATCLHVGPYGEIGPAYEALSGWMQANRHQGTGIAYEIYLDDPAQTPPHELKTQIAFLLR